MSEDHFRCNRDNYKFSMLRKPHLKIQKNHELL